MELTTSKAKLYWTSLIGFALLSLTCTKQGQSDIVSRVLKDLLLLKSNVDRFSFWKILEQDFDHQQKFYECFGKESEAIGLFKNALLQKE